MHRSINEEEDQDKQTVAAVRAGTPDFEGQHGTVMPRQSGQRHNGQRPPSPIGLEGERQSQVKRVTWA
jgi:hypothetical protein